MGCIKKYKKNDEYAIIYMDFRNDVDLMCTSMRNLVGTDNVKPFYGKGMTLET